MTAPAEQEFTFEVTVRVLCWPETVPVYPDDETPRTAADYALSALSTTSLAEASRLDGFADLAPSTYPNDDSGPDAFISRVEPI